jgi:hypothetical protein
VASKKDETSLTAQPFPVRTQHEPLAQDELLRNLTDEERGRAFDVVRRNTATTHTFALLATAIDGVRLAGYDDLADTLARSLRTYLHRGDATVRLWSGDENAAAQELLFRLRECAIGLGAERYRAWRLARALDATAGQEPGGPSPYDLPAEIITKIDDATAAWRGRRARWLDVVDMLDERAARKPNPGDGLGAAAAWMCIVGHPHPDAPVAPAPWATAIDAWRTATTEAARVAALKPLCEWLGVDLPADDGSQRRLLRKHRAAR